MTAITLKSLNFSTRLVESFANFLKVFLANMMIGMMRARQIEANRRLAREMIHEYRRGYTVDQLFHELNVKTLSDKVYQWKK